MARPRLDPKGEKREAWTVMVTPTEKAFLGRELAAKRGMSTPEPDRRGQGTAPMPGSSGLTSNCPIHGIYSKALPSCPLCGPILEKLETALPIAKQNEPPKFTCQKNASKCQCKEHREWRYKVYGK